MRRFGRNYVPVSGSKPRLAQPKGEHNQALLRNARDCYATLDFLLRNPIALLRCQVLLSRFP